MSRWVEKATKQNFSLLVSIPQNTPDMAKAAEAGGADAIKVHINTKHPASGRLFGNFNEERKKFEKILKAISIPLGIVPGGVVSKNKIRMATLSEISALEIMGFDFLDAFAHHLPLEYFKSSLGKMVCINENYSSSDLSALERVGAEIFEASIIPHDGYGKPPVLSDLAKWKMLTLQTQKPILVSTQRKLSPEDCQFLKQVGIKGVVIGIVVTGDTPKGVFQVTSQFRKAISS
jgi:putative N-acetylmannosamine-6-phosphate epimerase